MNIAHLILYHGIEIIDKWSQKVLAGGKNAPVNASVFYTISDEI